MTDTFERLKVAIADRYTIEYERTVYLAEDLEQHFAQAFLLDNPGCIFRAADARSPPRPSGSGGRTFFAIRDGV